MGATEAMAALDTSEDGLPAEEARLRLARDGPNELVGRRKVTRAEVLLKQLKDPMVYILLVAAALSGGVGVVEGSTEELLDAAVILLIVVINTVLGYTQEYKAETTLEALRDLTSPRVTVRRDGRAVEVPSQEVVAGDIMVLSTGDRVSADARLVRSSSMETDEASLTGESVPVHKDHRAVLEAECLLAERSNMVYSGSTVSRGRGEAVVIATGRSTELGRIAELVTEEDEGTPLQRKLAQLSRQLGLVVLGIAVLILLIGVVVGVELVTMFLTAISLAVAAIPEGLPAVVTVSLAIGLQRMVRRNAVVRRLPAVEALGSATVICTDKTGTLTRGEMNVREVALPGGTVEVTGEGYEPRGELRWLGEGARPDTGLEELVRAGVLCNDASLVKEGRWTVRGDGTEGTLLVLAMKAGVDPEALRRQYPRTGEEPFDSERKRMTTVHRGDGGTVSYTKGAAESVLPLCTAVLIDGREEAMTDGQRQAFLAKDREMASRALRVLALARGRGEERDLTFLGLVGMLDAPRGEAAEAIARCRTAGIRVIMITGDHPLTAAAIAQEMGIPSPGGVIAGRDLAVMPAEELSRRVKDTSVFARVAPEQKVRIVEALQGHGAVVAMTGDGVNDAPALKRADIGVAMGITGTDVAKEASDMVLTDDNFASIVAAVEEGRGIYGNIRKFVAFLLACNAGEIAVMLAAFVLLADEPALLPFLLPIQILWINLVTDSLPAIALGLEPPPPDVMRQCPRDPREAPVTRSMAVRIAVLGAAMAAGTLLAFMLLRATGSGTEAARTAAFCTVVLSQLLLVFSARDWRRPLHRLGRYDRLLLAVGASLLLQLAVVYLPVVNGLFHAVPLSTEWLVVVPFSLLPLAANELWKLVLRRRGDEEVCEVGDA